VEPQALRKEVIGNATLYLGDCLTILPVLGDVEAVITDPPFGVGNFVQTTGNLRGRGASSGQEVDWNKATPPPELFAMLRSMSKQRIIWGANFFNCFEDRGGAIIWDKCQKMPNFSKADIASCTHYQKTEIVRIPWTNFTVSHQAETDHPCERPVALYTWCINYLPPCAAYLDPYMGSGATGVAAVNAGKQYIGIERHEHYFNQSLERIDAAQRNGRLFA
jgi:site-specific DNA-methyltransferase (adenine-specific)